jgi:hypothetical protein
MRPSSFFVAPGSRRSVPASRSSWRRSSVKTSLCVRQRVGDRRGRLEVEEQAPSDRVVLVTLEEALTRGALFRLVEDR